jgi:flagellar hook-associated protein 2
MQRLGPLGGDSMLRMTQSRLREIIQDMQQTDSKYRRVIELGVEYNRNGTLNFNQDKFTKAVTAEPKEVIEFLRGDGRVTGFINHMKTKLGQITNTQNGVVTNRKKSMQGRMTEIDKRIERKEQSLAKREEQLRKQFSKMEESMARLQGQGAAAGSFGGGKA